MGVQKNKQDKIRIGREKLAKGIGKTEFVRLLDGVEMTREMLVKIECEGLK